MTHPGDSYDCRFDTLERKLDHLAEKMDRQHRQAMHNVDKETNEISAQIERLAAEMEAGGDDPAAWADQLARLRALSGTLNGIGKVPEPEPA
jgi:uncharacterized membrane protein